MIFPLLLEYGLSLREFVLKCQLVANCLHGRRAVELVGVLDLLVVFAAEGQEAHTRLDLVR